MNVAARFRMDASKLNAARDRQSGVGRALAVMDHTEDVTLCIHNGLRTNWRLQQSDAGTRDRKCESLLATAPDRIRWESTFGKGLK